MAAAVVYRVVLSQGLITIALKVSADRNSHQGMEGLCKNEWGLATFWL